MLSTRFTAHEALIVAEKATKVLDEIDAIIEKAVLDGHTVAHIMLYDHNKIPSGDYTEIGKVFNQAREFFIGHYERRRFIVEVVMYYLTIKCPK